MFSFLTTPTEEAAAPALSKEDAAKAEALANDDDFKDALEDEEIDGDKIFPVSPEELSIIRAELASDFPDDYQYLSDAYVLSVASKPYSKDPSKRRPLEVGDICVPDVCVCFGSEYLVANGAFHSCVFLLVPLCLRVFHSLFR